MELTTEQTKALIRARIAYLKAEVQRIVKPTKGRWAALCEYKSLEVLLDAIESGDAGMWRTR